MEDIGRGIKKLKWKFAGHMAREGGKEWDRKIKTGYHLRIKGGTPPGNGEMNWLKKRVRSVKRKQVKG